MSDYDGNLMDIWSDWDPLSSPSIREVLEIVHPYDYGLNPISETIPHTNLSTDPQPEQRSGGLRDRLSVRRGFNIPPLATERVNPFSNLVPSPILEISPGFSSLSPFLRSPNMFSNSSSQIIPPCLIPNERPLETVESSGGAHETMMISNKNIPHQPMDVDLPPHRGSDDIRETSIYIAPHESNADPIGAPLVLSLDSEVVAETDGMDLISLQSGSNDKEKEYNQEEDKDEDNNIVVEPSSRKRKNVMSNMMGVTRKNNTRRVIIQVESEEDHPDDGFRWRKYGAKIVRGNANLRSYYRCTYTGCEVKKHVQRSTDNVKLVMATYDGLHEHVPPPERIRKSCKRNQTNKVQSGRPYSSLASQLFPSPLAPQLFPSPLAPPLFPSLFAPQVDISGLSMLQSENHVVMNQDDEPKIDRVIPDGTEVFKGIRERLSRDFSINL